MSEFTLIEFPSRGAAYDAYADGRVRSLFHAEAGLTPEMVREHGRRGGLVGVHGLVPA